MLAYCYQQTMKKGEKEKMEARQDMQVIEMQEKRVLSTKQLAEAYGVETQTITNNFNNNKKRYIEGKHYIMLTGNEKTEFIKKNKIYFSYAKAKAIYFWTEKGALLHAKSLNTDKAWEVYDYLVDFYFRVKDDLRQQVLQQDFGKLVVDAPENTRIIEAVKRLKDDLICMNVLLDYCNRFVSKDVYEERKKQVSEVVNILMLDMARFTSITPNIVRKVY